MKVDLSSGVVCSTTMPRAIKSAVIAFSLNVAVNFVVALPQDSFLNSDEPVKHDAVLYLLALNRSLCYLEKHLQEDALESVSILNILIGIFFMKINLKHALIFNSYKLGQDIKTYLRELIYYSEDIHFKHRLTIDARTIHENIARLIDDDMVWLSKLSSFHLNKKRFRTFYVFQFEDRWPQPCLYMMHCWNKLPFDFDPCYSKIQKSNRAILQCFIGDKCFNEALAGNDVGYDLSHRILIFVFAKYGRDCIITRNARNDDTTLKVLCERAFAESVYITNHWYENSDLLFEFVALCALNGESEFIRRTWFAKLLSFQSSDGDFTTPITPQYRTCQENLKEISFDHEHFVSISVAALGAATRFTLEKL